MIFFQVTTSVSSQYKSPSNATACSPSPGNTSSNNNNSNVGGNNGAVNVNCALGSGNQVALSSPLLVNLLQNDGTVAVSTGNQKIVTEAAKKSGKKPAGKRKDSNSAASSPTNLETLRSEDLIGSRPSVAELPQSSGPSAFAIVNTNHQVVVPMTSQQQQTPNAVRPTMVLQAQPEGSQQKFLVRQQGGQPQLLSRLPVNVQQVNLIRNFTTSYPSLAVLFIFGYVLRYCK